MWFLIDTLEIIFGSSHLIPLIKLGMTVCSIFCCLFDSTLMPCVCVSVFLWSYFLKNSLIYRTVRIWNTENPKKNKTVIKTKNKQGEKVLRLLDYDEDYDEVFGEVCRASHFSCISPQSSAQRLPFFFFTDFFWLGGRNYWQSMGLQCLLFVSAAKSIGSFL